MSVRVKICGITNLGDALVARDAGAWAIGFNFYPGSPRYVAAEDAATIIAEIEGVVCVGVFVNEDADNVRAIAAQAGLHALQFHGDENPAYCSGWSTPVMKALRIRDGSSVAAACSFAVDYILADSFTESAYGGTGRAFAWDLLRPLEKSRLILAGGLDPENVAEAVRVVRPFAVDVASGVESEPRRKDPEKIRRFVTNAIHA